MKLTQADIAKGLGTISGWKSQDNALCKTYTFDDFLAAMAFMNACVSDAERLRHHPDWRNVYNRVEVSLSTHDEGGVTLKDLELAAAMDRAAS